MWTHVYFIGKELLPNCSYESPFPFIPDYDHIIDIDSSHYSIDHVIINPQLKNIKIVIDKI